MTQANWIQSSSSRWLESCLRIVVAIQCIGLGGIYLFSQNERESDVFEWLLFDWGWPETLVQAIDNTGVGMTLAAGFLLCGIGWIRRRNWSTYQDHADATRSRSWLCWLDEAAAWWIAGWVLLISFAHMIRATLWAELTLAEDAVRYVAPMALAIVIRRRLHTRHRGENYVGDTRVAVGMLMIAASATFAAHGYKALMCYGPFTDLILLSDLQWTHTDVSQSVAERILFVIGVFDLFIAALLVITLWRAVALYMTVWGIVAAASRMTAYGVGAWPETLLRAANGGVPLAILGYWQITYWSQLKSQRVDTRSDERKTDGIET